MYEKLFANFCFAFVFFNRIFILDETLQLFRLALINRCLVLVSSQLLLSTHLPTLEGWTAELTVGLWLVVSGSNDGIRTHASRPRMI